jgi:predicted GIY-YIG superfamily endonuclease
VLTASACQTTYLYRLYDKADVLLYIGITRDIRQRMYSHAST